MLLSKNRWQEGFVGYNWADPSRLDSQNVMSGVSQILSRIEQGDPLAVEQLLPLVYSELRQLAAQKLAGEKPGQTLTSTALVHEAFLRLVGDQKFANSRHFFAAAAEAMRRILIDNARRKNRQKRGGEGQRLDLAPDDFVAPAHDERLLALDEALQKFVQFDPDKAELVKLRWFAGLSLDEAAKVSNISLATANRWWAYARAWLRLEISGENPKGS